MKKLLLGIGLLLSSPLMRADNVVDWDAFEEKVHIVKSDAEVLKAYADLQREGIAFWALVAQKYNALLSQEQRNEYRSALLAMKRIIDKMEPHVCVESDTVDFSTIKQEDVDDIRDDIVFLYTLSEHFNQYVKQKIRNEWKNDTTVHIPGLGNIVETTKKCIDAVVDLP